MKLFDILRLLDADIDPGRAKVHLAGWNGYENPLDVYREGRFNDWQARQTRKNFGRPVVVSLVALGPAHKWLFAGCHDVYGSRFVKTWGDYKYEMHPRPATEGINGRVVVHFQRPGRQSYLLAEKWIDKMQMSEMLARRLDVVPFPGFVKVLLSKQQLDVVVRHQPETWKSALSSVAGVYVISDAKTGKLYVGSATGDGGIWSRWCEYAKNGHGGNKELRALLRDKGLEHASNFRFGVLETADTRASAEDVRERESHWKRLLLSRSHGYNSN